MSNKQPFNKRDKLVFSQNIPKNIMEIISNHKNNIKQIFTNLHESVFFRLKLKSFKRYHFGYNISISTHAVFSDMCSLFQLFIVPYQFPLFSPIFPQRSRFSRARGNTFPSVPLQRYDCPELELINKKYSFSRKPYFDWTGRNCIQWEYQKDWSTLVLNCKLKEVLALGIFSTDTPTPHQA